MVVSLASRFQKVQVLGLALRIEIVLKEQVTRISIGHPRCNVCINHWLKALLSPSNSRRAVNPRLWLPEHHKI